MTTELGERRRARLLSLWLIAGALLALAAVVSGIEMRAARPDLASGPVIPGLASSIESAERISVVTAEATYRIERTARGWAMRDRGDYPVSAARLEQLSRGLEGLRYTRRMTSDPAKHERLGVGDPRQGGRGVLVQVEGARGALLVNVVLGVEPGGALYVRKPDEAQTWAADGELPPLRDPAAWLDLHPLDIAAERLVRVEIAPPEGRAYVLARDEAGGRWRIALPALAPLSQSTLAAAAERLTNLSPIDVQPAPAIQGEPRARIHASDVDGLAIEAELIESEGRAWLKLVARAPTPELEEAALAINNRAAAWAFALSTTEAAALAPSLSSLTPSADN